MDHTEGPAMPRRVQGQAEPATSTTPLPTPAPFEQVTARILAEAKDRKPRDPDPDRQWRLQRQACLAELARSLGPRYSSGKATFDRFQVEHAAQREILETLRQLADRLPDVVSEGEGLILYGPVGTGKDHLLAALLYAAAGRHGISCRWVNGLEFYGRLRDRMDTKEGEGEYLAELAAPAILAISDPIPPVRGPTPWNVEALYRLVDRRYRAQRCTWLTLNAANPEEAEAALSEPVFDRLRDSAYLVKCFWPSYRERNQKVIAPKVAKGLGNAP
jgi:DNA replication protein DnaC